MTLQLSSPAFKDHGEIPRKYTCEGEDTAPPLSLAGAPAGTKSFALIVDDPDAPDPAAPKTTWVHWVVSGIPPGTTSILEGGKLPEGAKQGLNDWKRSSYGGPCPPTGRHRYFFKLYALDRQLALEGVTKAQLEKAMAGHILSQAQLVGTYLKLENQ